jgi:hypothetical protein
MSIAKSGHDAWRLLFRVYDHHQPLTRPNALLEEALARRAWVRLTMIGVGKNCKNGREMGLKLGMPLLREQDVAKPSVLEQHHSCALRGPRLSQDRTLAHGLSARAGYRRRNS